MNCSPGYEDKRTIPLSRVFRNQVYAAIYRRESYGGCEESYV